MKLVGLTGGIACGKSSVSAMLRQQGIEVIDADDVAKDVVRKGRWGYRRVLAAFGPSVLLPGGEIDRDALGQLVFSNQVARTRLNHATHPAIGLELARRLLAAWLRCMPLVVVDMPLLFESGFYRLCRPCVLVACSPNTQLQRLTQRDGISEASAAARIASQMPLERKLQLADVVIENDGGLQDLQHSVTALTRQLQRHAWVHHLLLSPLALAGAALVGAAVLVWRK